MGERGANLTSECCEDDSIKIRKESCYVAINVLQKMETSTCCSAA